MVTYTEIDKENADYQLLQLADPNIELIQSYLSNAILIEATEGNIKIGCVVLKEISPEKIEFKNIAIH